jgi:hypothetical protein
MLQVFYIGEIVGAGARARSRNHIKIDRLRNTVLNIVYRHRIPVLVCGIRIRPHPNSDPLPPSRPQKNHKILYVEVFLTVLLKNEIKKLKKKYVAMLPVVVSLHLEVEDLALGGGGLDDEMLVKEGQHLVADLPQFLLNLPCKRMF